MKGGSVWMLTYSTDGRWIASTPIATKEREIRLWDANTGRPGREPLKCDGDVFCVAFSPDGTQIAAGFLNGSFQVIEVSTGESVVGPIKGHDTLVSSVVYSPDGRLFVTGSWDKSIRVWDSKTGVEVGKPMLGHKDGINRISITTGGRRIASAGRDHTVRVWDLDTRLQVGDSFDAHRWVRSVVFSPDGRYIISDGGNEGDVVTVSLWDTESFTIRASPALPTTPIPPPNQHRQACAKDTSSINSSLLDFPLVVQQQPVTQRPQERKPSVDDDWDTESIRPRLLPTEPQQHPPREQEISNVQPTASGHRWSHDIRERWQRIHPRKSRISAGIPDGSAHPPDEQPTVPVSTEFPTNQQARREKAADAQENARPSRSRERSSRNRNEANVAFGKLDERLVIAPPRGKQGRHFRARAQRGGVRAGPHADTESQDSDAESDYVDTGCLDAICFGEYFRRRRYLQGQ